MPISGTRLPLPEPLIVHSRFESHARQYPDRLAITYGKAVLTYRELNEQANRLAHYLLSTGIGEGSLVGVCLDRSPELMIGILAILKAGAAYVPLDTTYPAQRLRLMTSQLAQMRVVLSSTETAPLLGTTAGELLDVPALLPSLLSRPTTNPAVAIGGEAVCYVVFTSGSTGTPKATVVRHQGWFNLLNWLMREFGLDWRSSNLMVSSFGFDISQRSLMTPLFCGATQHLLPSRNFDPMMARRLVGEFSVRTLHCAPSTLYLLVGDDGADRDHKVGSSLDYVFVGGEPLNATRVSDWANRSGNRCQLVNVYGVAECTDVSTAHVLSDYQKYCLTGVPIGTPIYNVDIYILDDAVRPVGVGDTGEICISGIGVGAGYLNSTELNAERFVKVKLDGELVELYRTGDLGYLAQDGALMCVGRVDAQVKIRGMRIDLGDVETAVRATGLVNDAAVLAIKNENSVDARLVAFVIASDATFDESGLRARLRAALPANMIPSEFLVTSELPLNPNGKIDRMALAASMH
jgi:amino acid adenylation domain-containing protein